MPKKNKNTTKQQKLGSTVITKKSFWSYRKNRSRVYTLIFLLIMIYFYIINNSKVEPEEGPYPPGYNPSQSLSTPLE
jgi:hypothetical protein